MSAVSSSSRRGIGFSSTAPAPQLSAAPASASPAVLGLPPPAAGSLFHCSVCSVDTHDDVSLQQHLVGRPHKRRLGQDRGKAVRQRLETAAASAAAASSPVSVSPSAGPASSPPVAAAASPQRILPSPLARMVAYIDDLYDGLLAEATVSVMLAMQSPPVSLEDAVRQQWASVLMSPASQLTRDRAISVARNRIACMLAAECARFHVSAAQHNALQLQMLQRAFFQHSSLSDFPPLLRRAAGLAVHHGLVGQLLERDMGGSRDFRGHNYFAMSQLANHLLAQAYDPSSATHLLLHQCQMSAHARGRRYSDSDLPRPGLQGRRSASRGLPPSHLADLALLEDDGVLADLELDPRLEGDDGDDFGPDGDLDNSVDDDGPGADDAYI
jgi:hypothetical protein